jgi:hypothetical protein
MFPAGTQVQHTSGGVAAGALPAAGPHSVRVPHSQHDHQGRPHIRGPLRARAHQLHRKLAAPKL